jgi:CHAT domain-containing protein
LESPGELNPETGYSFLGMAPVFDQTIGGIQIQSETAYLFDTTFQSNANIRSSMADERSFAPLVNSGLEVTQIGSLFTDRGKSSLVLLKEGSTEQAFKTQSDQYNIIHLATHSFPHPQNGKLSGIAFFQPSTVMMATSGEDGILYAAEVPALNLNANLVVLSSCESSVGPILEGDGPYSLARTFREAGAEQVVSSLWKLYDNYSRDMMIVFYNELLNGEDTAAALKKAKLKMIKNKKAANPGIWSGLILIR